MALQRKTTIYDVAREAGVSRQTVSRVLNNRPDVARETRQRVKNVIQELEYQPSQLARSLSQGMSCVLGIVGYGIEYYGPSRTLSVVESEANQHGYSITLSLTHEPENIDVKTFLKNMLSQHVDGIIWAVPQIADNRGLFLETVENISTPIVCANMLPHPSFSLIDSDNHEGSVLATQHLIDQGNSKIGIITGPLSWLAATQRFEGWLETLKKTGLSWDENLFYEGDWSASSGYQGLFHLYEKNPDLDAVFACNDQMALGVLKAADEFGKRVPEELAVVGYDNIPESEYFSSPLTTVRQNFSDQGKKIVDEIERRIREGREGKRDSPKTEIMKPRLIIRDSSRKKR